MHVANRTVIVVDGGLATGATMRAAVRAARRGRPTPIVVAVPVGSREACEDLAAGADAVVCPRQPEPSNAVGRWYAHFPPTTDDEALRCLGGVRVETAQRL